MCSQIEKWDLSTSFVPSLLSHVSHRTELIREPVSVITLFIVVDFISISLAEIALNSSIPSRYILPHTQRPATEDWRKYNGCPCTELHAALRHTISFGTISPSHSVSSLHPVPPWFNLTPILHPESRQKYSLVPERHQDSQFITDVRTRTRYSLKASLLLIIRVNCVFS